MTTCQEVKDDDVIPVASGHVCSGTSGTGSWLRIDQTRCTNWRKFPFCHLHGMV